MPLTQTVVLIFGIHQVSAAAHDLIAINTCGRDVTYRGGHTQDVDTGQGTHPSSPEIVVVAFVTESLKKLPEGGQHFRQRIVFRFSLKFRYFVKFWED